MSICSKMATRPRQFSPTGSGPSGMLKDIWFLLALVPSDVIMNIWLMEIFEFRIIYIRRGLYSVL